MKEEPDRQILKLSDAFQTEGGCIECETTMLNINLGRNMELMEKCRRLEEYATFVSTVRKYTQSGELELGESIRRAMDECIEKGILSDILTNQRAEVFAVLLETFDKELYERDLRENIRAELKTEVEEEVREAVKAEVKEEVRKDAYRELLRDGLITPEEACQRLQISRQEAEKLMQ